MKPIKNPKGKPSDHNVTIVAPRTDINFRQKRHKKRIHVRPQPKSKVADFMQEIGTNSWDEIFEVKDPHERAHNFHTTLVRTLNKHLSVKSVNMTSLDKQWFTPTLKIMYNEMQKEYFQNRKSARWRLLKRRFKSSKIKASKEFHSNFVNELKSTNPGQYRRTAKMLGGIADNIRET